jgi:hypothetical protein
MAEDHGNEVANANANVQGNQTNFINFDDLSHSKQSNPHVNFVNLESNTP